MDDSQKKAGSTPESKGFEAYYKKVKIVCQSNNQEKKMSFAEEIAKKIDEEVVFLLLKKLSVDIPPCRRQAIIIIGKAENPSGKVLNILISLLKDTEFDVRNKASETLAAIIAAANDFELAERLFKGLHEEKKCALKSYGGLWQAHPERVIQCLEDAVFQEENYAIQKNIFSLLAEIGKKFPERITKIFDRALQEFGVEEKKMVLEISNLLAMDHPSEFLRLLDNHIQRSRDASLKLVPGLLPMIVDRFPERTFELLRTLVTNMSESIQYSVMISLQYFEKKYPEETMEVLFELWRKTSDEKSGWIGDEHVSIETIKSDFIKIAVSRPSKAFSILKIMADSSDAVKRRSALTAAIELASKSPSSAFSLLETFVFDSEYSIKRSAISNLGGKWNTFKEETATVLECVMRKEIENLKGEIEAIFIINKENPNKIIELLRALIHGDSKNILDTIHKTASQLYQKSEEIPEGLLSDGTEVIIQELITYLSRNSIEDWESGIEILEKLSKEHEISMKFISIGIVSRFFSTDLNVVFEVLRRLAGDGNSQMRLKALEFITELIENFPTKSFEVVSSISDNQNPDVRTDIAKFLSFFKRNFEKESFHLLKKYTKDSDPGVRRQVALSISEYTGSFRQETLETIAMYCQDENALVQRAAFEFLEEYIKENSKEVLNLIESLHFKYCEPSTRERIAAFLSNFDESHTRGALKIIEDLARDQNRSVRYSAFTSLDKISKNEPEKTMEALAALAIEIDPEIRQKVIRSMGTLGEFYPSIDIEFFERFLRDDDVSVATELALTLGKIGKANPTMTTNMFKKMLLSLKTSMLGEAIAEAMADYGIYCPYEAMKILFYLSKYPSDAVSRRSDWSLHTIRKEKDGFSHVWRTCFNESFGKLEKSRLLHSIEGIAGNIIYDEEDSYMKELLHRYSLYSNLLRLSTTKKINASENLLVNHINNHLIIDKSIEKALLILKNIAFILGKQDFYSRRDDKIENLKDCLDRVAEAERQFVREFNEFDNPDYSILKSILESWKEAISLEFVKIRGKSVLNIDLESKNAVKRETTIVRLKLMNTGISKAENIVVSIHSSDDYTIVSPSERTLKILSPNESDYAEFHIKTNVESSVRVAFSVVFDDAEKEGKNQPFGDQINFIHTSRSYVGIKNPYIPGTPLRTQEMFYGRDDLLGNIESMLKMADNNHILILYGQRRTGKTSILYQLKLRLKDGFLPVIFDFQGIPINLEKNNEDVLQGLDTDNEDVGLDTKRDIDDIVLSNMGTDNFFHWMAFEIWRELSRRNITIPRPKQIEFSKNPAFFFRNVFLQEVRDSLGNGRLVFMMDEFEAIDSRIREGEIDKNILAFMRNLMQHSDRMDFIFSGSHRLEEMSSDYWSILFNIGLHHRISFLKRDEAIELICDPVKNVMEYDTLAVEKILEMTAGHPYFIQLICYYLVNHQIRARQNYVTIEDVNDVLEDVVVAGTYHFQYFWERIDQMEQIVLLTLAKILSLQSVSTSLDIVKYLQQYHYEISEQKLREVLEKLLKEEVLEQKTSNHYRFKVDLVRLWCEKNKEVYEVLEGNK